MFTRSRVLQSYNSRVAVGVERQGSSYSTCRGRRDKDTRREPQGREVEDDTLVYLPAKAACPPPADSYSQRLLARLHGVGGHRCYNAHAGYSYRGDTTTQLPVSKQYSPTRKVNMLNNENKEVEKVCPPLTPLSDRSGPLSQEEPPHALSDRSSYCGSRTRPPVHIGGVLTLPKREPRDAGAMEAAERTRRGVLQGCLDIEALVSDCNIRSADTDIVAFSKSVRHLVSTAARVIHLEPTMRQMMLAFLHISSSWYALSSIMERPGDSLTDMSRVFRRWQECSDEMLETIAKTLRTIPGECEKYLLEATSPSTGGSPSLDESRPRRERSRGRGGPRARHPRHANRARFRHANRQYLQPPRRRENPQEQARPTSYDPPHRPVSVHKQKRSSEYDKVEDRVQPQNQRRYSTMRYRLSHHHEPTAPDSDALWKQT